MNAAVFFQFKWRMCMNLCSKLVAVALMAAAAPWVVAPAAAMPVSSLGVLQDATTPPVEAVRYRHGGWYGGRGYGVGAGIVAGAIIGGAIAGRGYGYGAYGYAPYGYSGYSYDPGYDDEGYVAVAPGGGGDGYCMQRYRSYDPASGTFLGYDGLRHPCP
jgi:hypothetical protein